MLATPRVRKTDVDAIVFEAESRRVQQAASTATKLGTVKGVFVPTLQNIMGIILFVRVPFIVGQAGILEGLGIIWLSCATALLTAVSMSAVATNGRPTRTDAGKEDDVKLEEAVKSMLKAGGVLAKVLVLRLGEEDAPRFARDASFATPTTPTRQQSMRTRARGLTRGSS